MRLVVPGRDDRTEEVGPHGRIYHIQAPPARFNPNYRTIYPSQFLGSGSKLQKLIAAERPDLVEICDKYTLNYLGALLRRQLLPALDFRPVVIGLSCERMDDNFRTYIGRVPFADAFCSFYMKWLYFPFFDHHIVNSDYTAGELRAAAQGQVVSRNTWVRHMGIDLHHLSPDRRSPETRRRLLRDFGASSDSVLLLYAGRLVPEKNLRLLFDLIFHLSGESPRKFYLLVAGDGIERDKWEVECDRHIPGRVLFLGHVKDRTALADLYANTDMFVHPNPREPFGIGPLEAMASGLPLVAPNCGGVTSYANPQNAWTVGPTVKDFARAVEEIAENPQLRAKKVSQAVLTASEYQWENVASSFLDLYSELCRTSSADEVDLPPPQFSSTRPAAGNDLLFRTVSSAAEWIFAAFVGQTLKPTGVQAAYNNGRSGSSKPDPTADRGPFSAPDTAEPDAVHIRAEVQRSLERSPADKRSA